MLSGVRPFVTPWTAAHLLCPWNSPGNNTGLGWHFLLQGIFLTQGWNSILLHLLHWQADSLLLHHLGSPLHIKLLYDYLDTDDQTLNEIIKLCLTSMTSWTVAHRVSQARILEWEFLLHFLLQKLFRLSSSPYVTSQRSDTAAINILGILVIVLLFLNQWFVSFSIRTHSVPFLLPP